MEVWIMQGQSLCILLLMIAGIIVRRRRDLHVKIMSTAIIWDLILILQVELSRKAILKASNALENPMILNVHVALAVSAVVFYGLMVYTGRALLSGKTQIRSKHRILGYSTFLIRVLVFVTSFWAVVPKD
jgi:hypothetical protein